MKGAMLDGRNEDNTKHEERRPALSFLGFLSSLVWLAPFLWPATFVWTAILKIIFISPLNIMARLGFLRRSRVEIDTPVLGYIMQPAATLLLCI